LAGKESCDLADGVKRVAGRAVAGRMVAGRMVAGQGTD